MKRRAFVRYTSLGVGAAVLGPARFVDAVTPGRGAGSATDVVTLGRTGIKVSRLAQGTGTNGWGGSSDQTRSLGVSGLADLLRAGVDQGLSFWDLADQYGSHPHAREALKTVRRDRVVILTKTHATTATEMRADLDRFLRELGTDHLDVVLLHCMMEGDWPERRRGAMEVLSEAKEKGVIRAHGTSCHTLPALKAAAASDWVDVDLARLNPIGAHMDASPAEVIGVLREMKSKGKGVIGMKILAQGRLGDRVDEALRYALSQDVLDAFTIGAASRRELKDLIGRFPAASAV
jgi:1-deoxyxylulose-5-phosphate synthase